MKRSYVAGLGLGVPSRVMTNKDFEKIVETSDEWIQSRTGIKERRFVDREQGETLSSISIAAANEALAQAGLSGKDLSLVICCTASPDTFIPNTSTRIAEGIGAKGVGAMDLNGACSGFVMGMHTADAFVRAGMAENVLVVGGDVLSAVTDFKDRSTCVLFGDGAGAAVLKSSSTLDPAKDSMVIDSTIHSLLDAQENLAVKGGGSRFPFALVDLNKADSPKPYLYMNGQEVFKTATRCMAQVAQQLLERNKISMSQIRWMVPHQANLRIIEMVARLLDFPMEKVFVNLDRWGNTSAGTVPIALGEMNRQGLLKKGDLILLDVFGGGYSYGACLIRW